MSNEINSAYRIQPISPIYPTSDRQPNSQGDQYRRNHQRENEPKNYKKRAQSTLYSKGSFSVLA